MLQNTRNLSLTVVGSFWGRRRFLVIFVQFHWFDPKKLFPSNQNFPQDFSLLINLRKNNFLSNSLPLSEITPSWPKRDFLSQFQRKCFKTPEKHSLAVVGSIWGRRRFLVIFVHLHRFDQKYLWPSFWEEIYLVIFIPFHWFDPKKLFHQI